MVDPTDASAYEYAKHINIRLLNGYLRYYMHVQHPEKLSDHDWAEQVQTLHFIRVQEKEASEQK